MWRHAHECAFICFLRAFYSLVKWEHPRLVISYARSHTGIVPRQPWRVNGLFNLWCRYPQLAVVYSIWLLSIMLFKFLFWSSGQLTPQTGVVYSFGKLLIIENFINFHTCCNMDMVSVSHLINNTPAVCWGNVVVSVCHSITPLPCVVVSVTECVSLNNRCLECFCVPFNNLSDVSSKVMILCVPRVTHAARSQLEDEGLAGSGLVTLHPYCPGFIPLDEDLLTLELPTFFRL